MAGLSTALGGGYTTYATGKSPTKTKKTTGLSTENDIYAPTRTSISDVFKTLQDSGSLPDYTAVDYTPVANLTNQFDDNYFANLESQATKSLNDRYFNNSDSLQKQLTNQMNKRGLIGSGIEVGGTTDLYKNFGDDLVDVQSDLLSQRYKSDQDVSFKNADIAAQNAQNQMEAAQKNRDFQGFLSELGLRAAGEEAKSTNDFNSDLFKSQTELYNTDKQFLSDQYTADKDSQAKLLSTLNDALGNDNIDPETRDALESVFASMYGDSSGYDIQSLLNDNSSSASNSSGADYSKMSTQERYQLAYQDPALKAKMQKYGSNDPTKYTNDEWYRLKGTYKSTL